MPAGVRACNSQFWAPGFAVSLQQMSLPTLCDGPSATSVAINLKKVILTRSARRAHYRHGSASRNPLGVDEVNDHDSS